jgi:S-formylglutathione hydrolase FrmB
MPESRTDLRGPSRPPFFLRVEIPFVSACTGVTCFGKEKSFYLNWRQAGFHTAWKADHPRLTVLVSLKT